MQTKIRLLLGVAGLATAVAACAGEATISLANQTDCAEISRIKQVPAKPGVLVEDPYYNEIMSKPEVYADCLIDRIMDETPMTDPRSAPTRTNAFVVGDLAFFLLTDIGLVSFDDVLPAEVKQELPERGVLAYFEWVQLGENRKLLQRRSRAWVESARP